MSSAKVASPVEAKALLDQGYQYLDVRSEPEFEAGHPPGAFNVPLLRARDTGLETNEDFLSVVRARFPVTQPVVVGCKTGGRSRRALEILEAAGYEQLVELGPGWDGKRDAFGRQQPGWCRSGLPVECGQPAGRCYADLVQTTTA
jgi:rhodanese-related sulfurtransferase